MARKKAQTGKAPDSVSNPPVESTSDVVPTSTPTEKEDEPVKVNNASLQELKYAVDDYVKEHYTTAGGYDASHKNEDVHLALGWTCVLISGATSLYAWYTPFAQSKPLTLAGVILYFVLAGCSWVWDNLIVREAVFVGHKQAFEPKKRIQAQALTIHTKQLLKPVSNPPLQLRAHYTVRDQTSQALILDKTQDRWLSFTEVFDSEGQLHKDKLSAVLEALEQSVSSS